MLGLRGRRGRLARGLEPNRGHEAFSERGERERESRLGFGRAVPVVYWGRELMIRVISQLPARRDRAGAERVVRCVCVCECECECVYE